MNPLFSKEEFEKSKSFDYLPCKCNRCEETFYRTKHQIQKALNPNRRDTLNYCSKVCQRNSSICSNCGKIINKRLTDIKNSKTGNVFCSRSCSATYNNTHKTIGNRRSKLEMWIEEQLTILYPNLEIHYNKTDAINSELDIYIPSIKLAFELNGIFHYEPIYGELKLSQVQNNDNRKFQACLENNIEFCIIDTSELKYFKPINSKKYLDIINNVISQKLII